MKKITVMLCLVLLMGTSVQALASTFPSNFYNYTPGSAVPAARQDASQALSYDASTDDQSGQINFVSLGFGGSVVLTFDRAIKDGAGSDFTVYETTWGTNADNWRSYKETVSIYGYSGNYDPTVTFNDPALDSNWVLIGTAQQDGSLDLQGTGLTRTTALLFLDISRESGFTGGGDGYDIDGVVATNQVPIPAAAWLLGSGLLGLLGLRRKIGK